jgi:hypothetical protein
MDFGGQTVMIPSSVRGCVASEDETYALDGGLLSLPSAR